MGDEILPPSLGNWDYSPPYRDYITPFITSSIQPTLYTAIAMDHLVLILGCPRKVRINGEDQWFFSPQGISHL